ANAHGCWGEDVGVIECSGVYGKGLGRNGNSSTFWLELWLDSVITGGEFRVMAIPVPALCDIHDRAYMHQVVLDNVLNSRTRELIFALHKAIASCDVIRARELEKDKAYAELERKCIESLLDLDKNLLVVDMRTEIETLLFKAWQLNIHKKNSLISSKPDHAYICTINIITSYGDVVTPKRGKYAYAEEYGQKVDALEDQTHQEFNIGNDDVTPLGEALDNDGLHQLKINNMTQEVLTVPTFDLIKRMCKSVVELEYHLEEVFKATNDRLDGHNPKGKPYPHDLSKPLPLIQNERGRQLIPLDYFIKNDIKYLKGGCSSKKYTTSVTKTKAADYGQVKWIKNKDYPDGEVSQIVIHKSSHPQLHFGNPAKAFMDFKIREELKNDSVTYKLNAKQGLVGDLKSS
nr:hypothetical protein [Tanacetum cinerariifolium]